MTSALVVLVTALSAGLAASVLTLGALWWLWRSRLHARLLAELDRHLDEGLRRLGDTVEARVKKGVLEAVAEIPPADAVRGTTRAVMRAGSTLLAEGIERILDPRR